ncbi:MAG: CBS domain-containing protein [Candidatus Omnitrophica bacterium]|nr:CBS domain-containing protein [Candidatus Omnitrophota bacterium]MCF7878175.1 CBS domain-containing protein [Candidatus Omnitrophota bacterium]MCF7892605.1 CBS domain-containing protein [Candidatus Omnitrophota bacterium]
MAKKKKQSFSDILKKRLKAIKAKDIMTKTVVTIGEDKTLSEVAKIMIKKRISGLPVLDKKKKLTGIIVDHDLFLVMDMIESGNVIEQNSNTKADPKVNYVMSSQVITIKKDTNLDEIISIMKYKNVHTLPVLQRKKIVGIIGRRDVYQTFYNAIKNLKK